MTEDDAPDYQSADDAALDANAVGGMLAEIFGSEMTAVPSRCAHCGNRALVGSLRVYGMRGMGIVMRCSICTEIVMRFMRRPDGTFLVDARGAAYLRL
jgi:Family of unknown function (DUF6510)